MLPFGLLKRFVQPNTFQVFLTVVSINRGERKHRSVLFREEPSSRGIILPLAWVIFGILAVEKAVALLTLLLSLL